MKDPEAEAAFEALRGLVESSLQSEFEKQQELKEKAKLKKPTARKSTNNARKGDLQGPPAKRRKLTARKSTGLANKASYSYYRVPQDPVDFNEISTRMSIGGMEITLNASKLADMVNLKPLVKIKDCETSNDK